MTDTVCVPPFAAAMRMERRSWRMATRCVVVGIRLAVVVVAADALGQF